MHATIVRVSKISQSESCVREHKQYPGVQKTIGKLHLVDSYHHGNRIPCHLGTTLPLIWTYILMNFKIDLSYFCSWEGKEVVSRKMGGTREEVTFLTIYKSLFTTRIRMFSNGPPNIVFHSIRRGSQYLPLWKSLLRLSTMVLVAHSESPLYSGN